VGTTASETSPYLSRRSRSRLRALLAAGAILGAAIPAAAAPPRRTEKNDPLSRARALDKEGAKAYAEGRYRDAIRAFEEAYRLGGPAFELWNIAKCHLRLDQSEQAADMLERYLAIPNIPKDDREEANQQLESLKKRPSTLTVTSTPSGAQVALDGKAVGGKTPLSLSVPAGQHSVTVTSEGGATQTKQIDARFGRAITVEAGAESRPPPPDNPYVVTAPPPPEPRVAVRGALGVVLPRFGTIGGNAGVGFTIVGTYRLAELPPLRDSRDRDAEHGGLGVGALVSISGDSWGNRTGFANEAVAQNCAGPLHDPQSATALSFFGVGTATLPIIRRLRATAIGGVGLAAYATNDIGGDLFVPSCSTKPGVRPALLLGTQLDYAVTPLVRLTAFPLLFHIQPAFDGVRASPRDASGIWMRFELAAGAGVDF
jgi:hypothetical protein